MKIFLIIIGIIYGISLLMIPYMFLTSKQIDKDSDLLD